MTKEKVGLRFGALCPTIEEQLKEQGFSYAKEQVVRFQKSADSITYLKFHDILPESQAEKCMQRLVDKIGKHVSMNNKTPKP